jgi:hypothetical protein
LGLGFTAKLSSTPSSSHGKVITNWYGHMVVYNPQDFLVMPSL